MKKLLFLVVIAGFHILPSVAQNNKVVTAYNYHKYYNQRGKKADDLLKAEEAINEAVRHEQTMQAPKAWYYRTGIYNSIVESKEPMFLDRRIDAIKEVILSAQKTKEFDVKKEYKKAAVEGYYGIDQYLVFARNHLINSGVEKYNEKKYTEAVSLFEVAIELSEKQNEIDTIAISNAALASEFGKISDKMEKYTLELIRLNYGGVKTYLSLIIFYKDVMNNDDKALELTKKARTQFPDDKFLILEELNVYLKRDQLKEALANLKLASEKDPSNHVIVYFIGQTYDKLANPAKEKPQPTVAQVVEYVKEAEAAYKKAIELKADYFDALYNLGALYFNEAVKINDAAQTIKDNAKYTAEMKKVDAKFEMALPFLEKAHEIDPKDRSTLESLKQLYARTGQTDKYKKMKELLAQ
jgi:tetratricopeptide (TPR) repeat protein